jgi:hypothetical protein
MKRAASVKASLDQFTAKRQSWGATGLDGNGFRAGGIVALEFGADRFGKAHELFAESTRVI